MSIVKHLKIAMSTSTKDLEEGCKTAAEKLNKIDKAAMKTLDSLKDSIRVYSMGGAAAERFSLQQKGVNQTIIDQIGQARQQVAAIEQAKAAQEAAAAADAKKAAAQHALNQSARQHLASLRDEIRVLQIGSVEAERYRLALQGIDTTTRNNIANARNHIAQLQEQKRAKEALAASARHVQRELENEAEAWHKLTRTPKERAHSQFGRLNQMRGAGLLSDDTFQRSRQHIIDELKKIEDQAKKVGSGNSFSGLLTSLAKIGAAIYAVRMAFDGLKAAFGKPLKLASEFEQTEIGISVLLGSTQKAMALITRLNEYAAETHWNIGDVQTAARQMIAYGWSINEILPSLRRLSDTAASVSMPLGDLIYLTGTLKVQGRAFSKDINQYLSRGLDLLPSLARQLKTSRENVMSFVEAGAVGFEMVDKAITELTDTGGRFHDMTKRQSESIGGLWSNLEDSMTLTLAKIGTEMVKAWDLKDVTKSVTKFIETMRNDYFPTVSAFLAYSGEIIQFWRDFSASITDADSAVGGVVAKLKYLNDMMEALYSYTPGGMIRNAIFDTFDAGFRDQLEKAQAAKRAADQAAKDAAAQLDGDNAKAATSQSTTTKQIDDSTNAMKRFGDIAKQAFESTRTPAEKLKQELKDLQAAFNAGFMDLDTLQRSRKQKIDDFLGFTDQREQYKEELKKIEKQRDTGRITNDEFKLKHGELKSKYLGVDFNGEAQAAKVGLAQLQENFTRGLISKEEMEKSGLALMPDILEKAVEESKTPIQKFNDEFKKFEEQWGTILNPQQMQQARGQMWKEIVESQQKKGSRKDTPQFASFSTRGSTEAWQSILRHRTGFAQDPQQQMLKVQQEQLKEQKKTNQHLQKGKNGEQFLPSIN